MVSPVTHKKKFSNICRIRLGFQEWQPPCVLTASSGEKVFQIFLPKKPIIICNYYMKLITLPLSQDASAQFDIFMFLCQFMYKIVMLCIEIEK